MKGRGRTGGRVGIFLCWWASLVAGFGQNVTSFEGSILGYAIPPAPESRILDEAGMLEFYEEEAERIGARLKQLETEHDLPIYLVIYSSLVVGNVAQRPRDLYNAWIGEGHEGVVVVCEIDSRRMGIAFPMGVESDPTLGGTAVTRFPDYRMIPVIRAINEETKGIENKVEYLDRLTGTLAAEIDGMLTVEEKDSDTGPFVLVTLVLGGLIGLLGYFGHRYVSRAEKESHEQFYFPDVEVGARLGAPYGGARVNTLSFQVDRKARDGGES